MFDRITNHARKAMGNAREAAHNLCHDYIGTEHLLLGLLDTTRGTGNAVLRHMDVRIKELARDVLGRMEPGTAVATASKFPFTPGAKRALEGSLEEAGLRKDAPIGTEHLLLGLIRDDQGIAGEALRAAHVELEAARAAVRRQTR